MFEIGNSLREARLRQQLDFPELEQATKIRSKYLRALEDEEFDALPAETYVKGFLRSYAEYLGLDGQLYVDEYNSRYVVGDEEPVARPRRSRAGANQPRVDSRVVLATIAGIVAVTALFILAWKFGGSNNGQKIQNAGTIQVKKKHRARSAAPVSAHLVLRAVSGGCRLEVHRNSASGKLLYAGTLERGQRQDFTGKRLWIQASSPEALRMILNNRTIKLRRGGPLVALVTKNGIRPAGR